METEAFSMFLMNTTSLGDDDVGPFHGHALTSFDDLLLPVGFDVPTSILDFLGEDPIPLLNLSHVLLASSRPARARKLCAEQGCVKFARCHGKCTQHGGRRYCETPECHRVAQFAGKCTTHGGIKPCDVPGCLKSMQSRGKCKTHGGGVRCQARDCTKGSISNGFCRGHGGGLRCVVTGCTKWAQRERMCVRHHHDCSAADNTTAGGTATPLNATEWLSFLATAQPTEEPSPVTSLAASSPCRSGESARPVAVAEFVAKRLPLRKRRFRSAFADDMDGIAMCPDEVHQVGPARKIAREPPPRL
ncbi:hypothetical protein H257_10305 [Aphanomyces astaci]|uniref:Uncharacterized protein n=1 Tax=Aphanomyces astaci TaxID=112090 RepID=W4G936_APHAT|nr:hypothetical protein H257_10305 [Aphanomyces astaci]ETV75468.1 hypothetical protein H257_10305 [Aphanomyces astaci]|eukprot:XP_009835102.1 hypothetical protein H257_10305 [Aphanomyces astaci]